MMSGRRMSATGVENVRIMIARSWQATAATVARTMKVPSIQTANAKNVRVMAAASVMPTEIVLAPATHHPNLRY